MPIGETYYRAAEDAAWGAVSEEGWEAYLPPAEAVPECGLGWSRYLKTGDRGGGLFGLRGAQPGTRGSTLAPRTHEDNIGAGTAAERAIRRQLELRFGDSRHATRGSVLGHDPEQAAAAAAVAAALAHGEEGNWAAAGEAGGGGAGGEMLLMQAERLGAAERGIILTEAEAQHFKMTSS